MKGKTSKESCITLSQRVLPQDANPAGNVHGGVILKYIDTAAGTVGMRHARGNVVTASIDRMDFLAPVYVGELVTFKACMNYVGTTSMEIGVRVEAENLLTGEVRYTNSAYLTFVALDEHGRPTSVAPLILENEDEERRWREAKERRKARLAEKARERCSQDGGAQCKSD
ncbi:acyl-CoA thioesterase [Desulfovibrio ferrophilus]|uniref:Thioesterase superfamily protein n=1 Tax=Desulfovibrio ferrophilus TaxID=241368 RepID=A0A2Z6B3B4_9BACT|nr:acyl-CoA thioesterase [Desulfovibrio ferrophilus]BBD10024.1 thioesterase superfamily protein [Desulfovibrio ferrophilus]